MELPQSYFEPDVEPDFPFVDEELYYQTKDRLDEAEQLFYQLVDELYDNTENPNCKNVDRDCVHEIMKQLEDVLYTCVPSIENLKI